MAEPHGLELRRKALEESFYARKNAELLEQMRQQLASEHAREDLAASLCLADKELVSALVDAGIEVDTIAALSLVPMIAVAWADRKIDAAERDAIIKAAIEHGLQEGSKSFQLLEQWLETAPDDALVTHWTDYIAALQETMPPAQHRKLGEEVIGCARKVANSAGGFLGIGKISDAEEAMLNRLKEPFK